MPSLNETAEESKEQDPVVDEESIALKLKGHRAKIAGIIHGNSKESKTTKFRYLATDKELNLLRRQSSFGDGITLESAEAKVRSTHSRVGLPNERSEANNSYASTYSCTSNLHSVKDMDEILGIENLLETLDSATKFMEPVEEDSGVKITTIDKQGHSAPVFMEPVEEDFDVNITTINKQDHSAPVFTKVSVDGEGTLNHSKRSDPKSLLHMSPSDIALGVDKRIIDSKVSKKNLNKTMEDVSSHDASGQYLERQESAIDGRFHYCNECDGAKAVYRQCIASSIVPISTVLRQDEFMSQEELRYASDWEQSIVTKICAMLQLLKKAFDVPTETHNVMVDGVANTICRGYSATDTLMQNILPTPACNEDFQISENRGNAFVRACQVRLRSIVEALESRGLVVPDRFENNSVSECKNRLEFEICRLNECIKNLEKLLFDKCLLKPKLEKKNNSKGSMVSEVEDLSPKITKGRNCFSCFGNIAVSVPEPEEDLEIDEDRATIQDKVIQEELKLPTPCLDFDLAFEKFNATDANDMDAAEGNYLLLLKVLLQYDNKHMVTPETDDAFVYDFASCNVNFSESMSADNRIVNRSSQRSIRVASLSHTSFRSMASEFFYDDVKGVHALTKINSLGLELLRNYAMYYGIDELHEKVMFSIVYTQNFRGAMSWVMQPQQNRPDHILCLIQALDDLYNTLVHTRALKRKENIMIQQYLLINVESIIDDALRNYFKLFPSNSRASLDEFEDLLRLNVIYYRVMQVLLHLHEDKVDHEKLNHMAIECMWKDIERCLGTRSKELFQSFKTDLRDEKDAFWEYCIKKPLLHQEMWVPFNETDTMALGLAYVNNDVSKIEISNNVTVDLNTFERCDESGKHFSKIRGQVNGVEATPLYAVHWGNSYTVILQDESISFSLCYDVYSRKITVEDPDVLEINNADNNSGGDDVNQGDKYDNLCKHDGINVRTGMGIGDHLAFIGDWPTAGKPLGAVYSKLAAVGRPVTLRLYSSINVSRQKEMNFEYEFHVVLAKYEKDGKKYLGMELGAPKTWTMSFVMRFTRLPDGTILPAERCNQIRQGDLLVAINGIDVSKSDYSHSDTIGLLMENDILELTFKRINIHQSIQEKIKLPALSSYRLQEVAQEARVTLLSDQKFYTKSVEKILLKQIGAAQYETLDSSLLKINSIALYALIAKEVEIWISRNEPGPGASHYPDGYVVLYNTLKDFDSEMCDWAGKNWRSDLEKNKNIEPLNLTELFGQYVVSWIEHQYIKQTTKILPNMFRTETWDAEIDDKFPATSKFFMITLNTLLESYQELPNHFLLSNVVRFGKQGLCELFKFYTHETKESFRRLSVQLQNGVESKDGVAADHMAAVTNKLCVHVNAVYRCWSDFVDVLSGLNEIKSVHNFMGVEEEEEEDEIQVSNRHSMIPHMSSKDGNSWADNLKDDIETKLYTYRVKVRIFSAHGLPKLDYGGFLPPDPYIQMCVYEEEAIDGTWCDTFETSVVHNSQSPVYNQNFEFSVVNKNAKVVFRVLDHDHGAKAKEIGKVSMALDKFFYGIDEKAKKPEMFTLTLAQHNSPLPGKRSNNLRKKAELKLLIVSRETELGSSTLRFIDNQIDDMICNPSWGLIDSHVDTLRELVWDYLFDRNKKYRSLPKSVNEIKYSLVEERIDNLIGTMADIMNLIHGNLHERNFARALSRIWRVTIDLFIQFLLPTLDRAYPYLKKKDTWQFSSWDFDLGLRKKKKKSLGDLNLPEPKDRVKHVHYLNDVQVEMIRLAYDEIFSLLNCDGAKAGLKERKAKEQLGGDLLMLLEMWKAVDSVPELVMSETGTIASQMVIEEEKARKYGWDGTAGRRWRQLRDKKNHLYHLLLYAARIKHDKQAINFLESVLFDNDKESSDFQNSNSSSSIETETW